MVYIFASLTRGGTWISGDYIRYSWTLDVRICKYPNGTGILFNSQKSGVYIGSANGVLSIGVTGTATDSEHHDSWTFSLGIKFINVQMFGASITGAARWE